MGLATSSACNCCNGGAEDALHAVRDCVSSKQVWNSLLTLKMASHFYHHGMRDWVLLNPKHKDHEGRKLSWLEIWAIRVWLLWKWRNGEVFRSKQITLEMKMEIVKRSISDMASTWNGALLVHTELGPRASSDVTEV